MLLQQLATLAAALHVPAAGPTRRECLVSAAATCLAGVTLPARAADQDSAPVILSRSQIDGKLSKVPVIALVNSEDAPFLTGANGRIGYFFLDPIEALREKKLLEKNQPDCRLKVVTLPEVYFPLVRGEQADLGGELRLRPSRRQIVWANRALAFQKNEQKFLPTSLDENKGQVPIFYSERVAYESNDGTQTFPFFLSKDDLDAAYDELQAALGAGGTSSAAAASKADPKKADGGSGGIPIGLVRVATLDGLVDQMRSGAVDLSQSVVVAQRSSLNAVRSIVQDGGV